MGIRTGQLILSTCWSALNDLCPAKAEHVANPSPIVRIFLFVHFPCLTNVKIPYSAADGHNLVTQTLLARLPGILDENPDDAVFKFAKVVLEVTKVRQNSRHRPFIN